MEKQCSKCKETKEFSSFYKRKVAKDGLSPHCKMCSDAAKKLYNEKNPEKVKIWKTTDYNKHSESYKKRAKEHYNKHSESYKVRVKEYNRHNKDAHNLRSKAWAIRNKEAIKRIKRKHYLSNRENILRSNKEYCKLNPQKRNTNERRRMKEDLLFRITKNLRRRLRSALKVVSAIKVYSTIEVLGCSPFFLKKHLGRKFQKGMSWDNYGEWHIDHIIPCAKFDLTDPEQQKQCFHYTNLQPLWSSENIAKSDKILKPTQMSIPI